MPKLFAAASPSLCLVPVAACGGGSSLSKADFIKKGDAICGGLTKSTGKIATPTSNEEASAYLTETIPLAKAARAEFAALTPPTDGEDVQQSLLDALDKSLAIADKAQAAAAKGDIAKMTSLLTEGSAAGKAGDKDANKYGFKDCGTPSNG